ncbi:hypothetical protein P0C22_10975 [Plesiomonas shigelloides]|uniref:hypothetical protein n=1 Tax=Plesiomonas shigelloides TaxID=703 RepID=UPI0030C2F00C
MAVMIRTLSQVALRNRARWGLSVAAVGIEGLVCGREAEKRRPKKKPSSYEDGFNA